MLRSIKRLGRNRLDDLKLPAAAKAERRGDRHPASRVDPGNDAVEEVVLEWLAAAQDHAPDACGGVARHFSLIDGWGSAYPETSGYIVPTLIEAGTRRDDVQMLDRARRILDWLVGIQFPDGGFQGGTIGCTPVVPVTFNTGQILIGLAAGVRTFGREYEEPMHRAAAWLVDSMDSDGCWRRFPTPFAAAGEKVYETHVSWGLVEAARVSSDPARASGYASAALRNCRWALTHQQANGWFTDCCLEYPDAPLTHTIGYAVRGLVEVHAYTRDTHLLAAALRTARSLSAVVARDGFLAGRLDRNWTGTASWACLTGSAQIAHSLLLMFSQTGDDDLRDAAFRLLGYVRRTVQFDGAAGVRGGVKGSFPVDGEYGQYQYLNWAAKFLIDACQAERVVRASS
jgi:hypothetical protein